MNVKLEFEKDGVYYFKVPGNVANSYSVSNRYGEWWCDCHNFVIGNNKECKHIKACMLFLEERD